MKNLVKEILPRRMSFGWRVAIQYNMTKAHATIYPEIADAEGGMRCSVESHRHCSGREALRLDDGFEQSGADREEKDFKY